MDGMGATSSPSSGSENREALRLIPADGRRKADSGILKLKGITHMPAAGSIRSRCGLRARLEALHANLDACPGRIFQPAIYYAQNGLPRGGDHRRGMAGAQQVLAATPTPKPLSCSWQGAGDSEIFRNPPTLAPRIGGQQGPEAFYRGTIARRCGKLPIAWAA